MDTILQGVPGVACYIDGIIVMGKTLDEHMEHLEEVFKRLRTKCRFLKSSVNFLGHRIDAEGIHPLQEKLTAILQAPAPKSVQELRSFLRLINYYGKFIPNAASILAEWKWSAQCQRSFEEAN